MPNAIRFRKKAGIDKPMKPTWMVLGATSIIAQEFCHIVAAEGHPLILVGRDALQLHVISDDLGLRYKVPCEVLIADFSESISPLLNRLQMEEQTLSLFIAPAAIHDNSLLDLKSINELVTINILSTAQLIHCYLHKQQSQHQLIFLSSVAACRGRAKNSLYGGSKAAIETYLQGLQLQAAQSPEKPCSITIARLGFIDTAQTYGLPGIFYASPPKACAKACWQAVTTNKRLIYHPYFWRFIMGIISHMPFFIFKRMKIDN